MKLTKIELRTLRLVLISLSFVLSSCGSERTDKINEIARLEEKSLNKAIQQCEANIRKKHEDRVKTNLALNQIQRDYTSVVRGCNYGGIHRNEFSVVELEIVRAITLRPITQSEIDNNFDGYMEWRSDSARGLSSWGVEDAVVPMTRISRSDNPDLYKTLSDLLAGKLPIFDDTLPDEKEIHDEAVQEIRKGGHCLHTPVADTPSDPLDCYLHLKIETRNERDTIVIQHPETRKRLVQLLEPFSSEFRKSTESE